MKIAICQLKIIWENKKKNMDKAIKFVKEACQQNVDIIFFPEMSLTGFSMNIKLTKEESNETVDIIKKLAVENGIAIGIGWVKGNEAKAENHYTVIDSGGNIASDYIKIHLFSYSGEDLYFEPGNKTVVFKINNIMMSTLICYDLRFPETFQEVSNIANFIIVAANWPDKRNKHWECLLKARAIENQVYIIGVNCFGRQQEQYYSGNSCIINPNGEVLGTLSDAEGSIIIEVQDDVQQFRNAFPMKRKR